MTDDVPTASFARKINRFAGLVLRAAASTFRLLWRFILSTCQVLARIFTGAMKHPALFSGLIAILLILVVVHREITREITMIMPIGLPKELVSFGYSENVAAYRLRDSVNLIVEQAGGELKNASDEEQASFTVLPSGERVDFKVPISEFSLSALITMARYFLGTEESRIAGEFVCTQGNCTDRNQIELRLRLFSTDGKMQLLNLGPLGDQEIKAYFLRAAIAILEHFDPHTLAMYHLKNRDYRCAERIARGLVNPLNQRRSWGFHVLGSTAMEEKRWWEAEEYFRAAMISSPTSSHAEVLHSWGIMLRRRNSLEQAIERYDRALDIEPDSAKIHNSRGYALRKLGNDKEAERMYTAAIALDPEYHRAYFNRAVLLRSFCKVDEAIRDYRSAIYIKPDFGKAYAGLALALRQKGLKTSDGGEYFSEALRIYERMKSENLATHISLTNHGRLLIEFGLRTGKQIYFDQAIDRLDEALIIKPGYDRAHYFLGMIAHRAGRLEEAVQEISVALKKGRKIKDDSHRMLFASIHEELAEIYKKEGRSQRAESHRDEAKKLREALVNKSCMHMPIAYNDNVQVDE